MKQAYIDTKFKPESLHLIHTMNAIVASYVQQGYRMTVRQLYYQLVQGNVIPNTEKSYKRITGIVNDAKLAGLMDWDAIEDRTRAFVRKQRWNSPQDILKAAADSYHEDMWDNQRQRVFVIVEKEALVGVLERTCMRYDVPLLAARGYPSGTVLREFCVSDVIDTIERGQEVVILHLGDHDPSGIDMSRDLRERIELFGEDASSISLNRIALTMEQIKQQRPPPNPAKQTDARFKEYSIQYGDDSWELDALKPSYLDKLVSGEIETYIDQSNWDETAQRVAEIKKKIVTLGGQFK